MLTTQSNNSRCVHHMVMNLVNGMINSYGCYMIPNSVTGKL